ncbi:hypothetical protein JTL76_36975, partial [Pseudomonas aeruginosa]|nr:hypothetical protein [Pseudomonas aeruginosa]
PPLTCISWPLEALLDNCIQRIRSLIDDRPTFTAEGRSLAGRLIPRQSVADISRSSPGWRRARLTSPFRAFVSGLIITHACK